MPKISVIVPVYKVEAYINGCVDSILAQTFTDFELILVDDGSPDNCPKICDEYAKKDSRIHVVHKENGGLSSARNAGIDYALKNSDSKWLCFIDSDDLINPNYIEYLYRAVIENDVKIAVCGVYMTSDLSTANQSYNYSAKLVDSMELYVDKNVWATVAWNKLYAKDIFANYRYPVGRIHEDEFLTYKLLYNVKTVAWVDAQLYVYYRRDDSIMGKYNIKRFYDGLDAVNEQIEFFKNVDEFLYKNRRMTLIHVYEVHLKKIKKVPEYNDKYKLIKKEFKKIIKDSKKPLNISLAKTPHVYDEAYPTLMKLYWAIRLPLGKVKRAFIRIFKRGSSK